MNVKETYLYFAENLGGDAAGDCITVPASRFLGCDPISATQTRISFMRKKITLETMIFTYSRNW